MKRNRLYTIIGIACAMGYGWLLFSISGFGTAGNFTPCIFKTVTGYACPSCGSTRAAVWLFHGKILQSLMVNPLGLILVVMMIALPLWIFADIVQRKQTLLNFYLSMERKLQTRWIAGVLIALVLVNWIWNIYKEL
ncbi:MAG TPA: DUF2752 domain-containing protein [Flavobacterium sp.]|jgi:cytochrome c biogenesis protein CcdA